MITPTKMSDKLFISSLATAVIVGSPVVSEATPNDNATTKHVKLMIHPKQSLTYGQKGQSIRALQTELKKHNLYHQKVDGIYGPLTLSAVRQFQTLVGMTVSGIATSQTLAKIMESKEPIISHSPKEIQKLMMGSKGRKVKDLQQKLKKHGYYSYKIDGIFGEITYRAVIQFQKQNKLTVDGIAGKQTLTKLSSTNVVANNSSKIKVVKNKIAVDLSLVNYAKKWVGTPFKWGGTTPNGFDCSGYIMFVFKEKGHQLPRTVNEMWNYGKSVHTPRIGDLVFFETYKPGPSHAGIYLGDGKFIHTSSSNGVKISKLNQSYWKKRYLGAKRMVVEQ